MQAVATTLCMWCALAVLQPDARAQGAGAGPGRIDSLRMLVAQHPARDSVRAGHLTTLSHASWGYSADSGLVFGREALAIGDSLGNTRIRAQALLAIGMNNWRLGYYARAMEAYLKALDLFDRLGDEGGTADTYNRMGLVHWNENDLPRARDLFIRSSTIRKRIGPESSLPPTLINLGIVLTKLSDLDGAQRALRQALELSARFHDERHAALANLELGITLLSAEKHNEAYTHLLRARTGTEAIGDRDNLALTCNAIASYFTTIGQYDSALVNARRGLEIGIRYNSLYPQMEAYQELRRAAERKGMFREALVYALRHEEIGDTLRLRDNQKRTAQLELEYKHEKDERARQQAQQRFEDQQRAELRTQKIITWALIIGLLFSFAIAATLLRLNRIRTRHNEELTAKNVEIGAQKESIEHQKQSIELALSQLQGTEDDLRTALSARDRILSIIAHDLRGPLGSMRSATELLLEHTAGQGDDETQSLLRTMLTSSTQTANLLENLLRWAVEQRGVTTPEPSAIDLSGIVQSTIMLLSLQVSAKRIHVTSSLPGGLFIWADERMVTAVVRNLISNSIKYTYPEGSIDVFTFQRGDAVEFRIRDSGVGMSADLIDRVMSARPVRSLLGTGGEAGTGLGLLLCRDFTARNGGTFTIRSREGRGSEVIVSFPAHDASAHPEPKAPAAVETSDVATK